MSKLIILDRDGVINEDGPNYIKSPEEWIPIPGSLDAIAQLNQAGFKVVVATNQSGISKGIYKMEDVTAVHRTILSELTPLKGHIDNFFVCPHKTEDECLCRKPKPGMLFDIFRQYQVEDPSQIYFIGDSLRDLQAAEQAGCKPMLVLTGNGRETLELIQGFKDNNDRNSSATLNDKVYENFNINQNAKILRNFDESPNDKIPDQISDLIAQSPYYKNLADAVTHLLRTL